MDIDEIMDIFQGQPRIDAEDDVEDVAQVKFCSFMLSKYFSV